MRPGSRPISNGHTWSFRYDATASSRPFNVASPMPYTPSSVTTFNVTKLRPGHVTITSARTIFMGISLSGIRLNRCYHTSISNRQSRVFPLMDAMMNARSTLRRSALASMIDHLLSPAWRDPGVGIVHLGIGNFHRAHEAVYTEEAMLAAGGDWGICGVTLQGDVTKRDAL